MDIYKIAALALVSAILSLAIKKYSPEFALIAALCAGAIIFINVCSELSEVILLFKTLAENANVKTQYLAIALKAVGIAYVTEFAARLCSDAGEKSIAANVELAGKVFIMASSEPLITAFLESVLNLL